jgi:hypothetical protein
MSTNLSTNLLLSERNRMQILLTNPSWRCQLISPNANIARQAQADQLTLNQQVPVSSPGRRTESGVESMRPVVPGDPRSHGCPL